MICARAPEALRVYAARLAGSKLAERERRALLQAGKGVLCDCLELCEAKQGERAMAKKGNDWKKVGKKWAKWTAATAGAGLAAAAVQGADLSDPGVLGSVLITSLLAGAFGGGQNAWKHRAAAR